MKRPIDDEASAIVLHIIKYMATMVRTTRQFCRSLTASWLPRRYSTSSKIVTMDPETPFEERLPWNHPDQFYPVRLGKIFESKYKTCWQAWIRGLLDGVALPRYEVKHAPDDFFRLRLITRQGFWLCGRESLHSRRCSIPRDQSRTPILGAS
jgi:hypothetical protein